MINNQELFEHLLPSGGGPRAGPRQIRLPGTVLREADLLRRPRGAARRDELEIMMRPYGLHCIALKRTY